MDITENREDSLQEAHSWSWNAIWIGESWNRDADPLGGNPTAFYKNFVLENECLSSTFCVCAFAQYALWINGKIVAYGPARSFPESMEYDVLDVKRFLKKGSNHIAAVVKLGTGVTGYGPVSRMGFILQGRILCKNEEIEVVSNETWKACPAFWYHFNRLMISLPTGFQEHFSGIEEPRNWKIGNMTDGWPQAFYLGPVGTPPWKKLAPRSIPMLEEKAAEPPCVWIGKGSDEIKSIDQNLAVLFNNETLQGGYVSSCVHEYYENLTVSTMKTSEPSKRILSLLAACPNIILSTSAKMTSLRIRFTGIHLRASLNVEHMHNVVLPCLLLPNSWTCPTTNIAALVLVGSK